MKGKGMKGEFWKNEDEVEWKKMKNRMEFHN